MKKDDKRFEGGRMRVDPASFNPILGYKLDPGEPGLAHSAPASMSILRVLTQEVSNYLAFKREAVEKGGFIISGGIYLDLRKRGGFLAAVAGKTKVWMYIPGERNARKEEEPDDVHRSREDEKAFLKDKLQELKMKLQITDDPQEKERLEREIALLEMALSSFKASLVLPQFLVGALLDTLA